VVLVTTILFRDANAELAYPRLKSIIYLMQYCNHSLNFIFYGSSNVDCKWTNVLKMHRFLLLGITSPPYRRTLCEWFEVLFQHLPQRWQQTVQKRSPIKAVPGELKRLAMNEENRRPIDTIKPADLRTGHIESIALVPRQS
jgi:hypothetical protein